jgi:exonuclease V
MQLQLYKSLFDGLAAAAASPGGADRFAAALSLNFGLDLDATFSPSLQALLLQYGLPANTTLGALLHTMLRAFACFPAAHPQLVVEYEAQSDGAFIGREVFPYSAAWLRSDLEHYMQYWAGVREPEPATIAEKWKCRRCEYLEVSERVLVCQVCFCRVAGTCSMFCFFALK